MKIIFVNQNYPPHSGYGGIAVYLQTLARQLVKLGHQVLIVAGRFDFKVPEMEMDQGVEVHRIMVKSHALLQRIPVFRGHVRGLSKFAYSWKVCKKIQQLSKGQKIDLVEFADAEAEAFVYLKQKNRPKVVIRCHTPTFVLSKYYREDMKYQSSLISWMEKSAIRHADGLSAPSHDMAQQISKDVEIDEKKIDVIPNPVRGFSKAGPKRPVSESSRIQVLHVGRLDRLKGIDVLAKAIVRVVKKNPAVYFTFAGNDGYDSHGNSWREKLQNSFKEENISDNVLVLGFADEEKLCQLYFGSDIAVVPSILYESFSYTCAQAMAAALPLVASRIGGIPETVEEGMSAILVEPGNVSSLTDAILKLANDAQLRAKMGQSGYVQFLKKLESEGVTLEMIKFYEQIVRTAT